MLIISIFWLLLFGSFLTLLLAYTLGFAASVLVSAAMCALMVVNVLLLKRGFSHNFVAGLLILELLAGLGFLAFENGGTAAPAVLWSLPIPLLAALLVGRRFALISAGLLLIQISVFFILQRSGFIFPQGLSDEWMIWFRIAGLSMIPIFLTALGWFAEAIWEANEAALEQDVYERTESLITTNQKIEHELALRQAAEFSAARQVVQLSALLQASQAITGTLELEDVLAQVAEWACKAVGATSAYFNDWNPDTQMATVVAEFMSHEANAAERVSDFGTSFHLPGDFPIEYATLIESEAIAYSITDEDLDPANLEHMMEYGVQSIMTVPLLVGTRIQGFIEVWESRKIRTFRADEISICQGIASQAAIAIENIHLYAQAERRATELATLLDTTRAITSSLDLDAVLLIIAEKISAAIGTGSCTLSRWDKENDSVVTWIEWTGVENNSIDAPGTHYPLREVPATRAVLENRKEAVIYIDDPLADPAEVELLEEYECRAMLMLPLALADRVIGLIELHEWRENRRFTERDIRLCEAMADEAAIAIEHARLFEQVQQESEFRKQAQAQLFHDAFHDALTQLPNRALLMDRLTQAFQRARIDQRYTFAILFLDFDRFKLVNDSLGHDTGDQLLMAISRKMESFVRGSDTVARHGGDEFVILLDDIRDPIATIHFAERLGQAFEEPFEIRGRELLMSASIGIVISSDTYEAPDAMLRDADIAMYRAKMRGQGQYQVFDAGMRERIISKMDLETELRQALQKQEFVVYYQPIVNLENRFLIGFEALVRWNHPERGLLAPGVFIGQAEESDLIIPMDRWVLTEACRQVADWQNRFDLDLEIAISVNLSGKQFARPDLVDQVWESLRTSGLPASALRLEITESTILENTRLATEVLTGLRQLGVRLQIDDFGTGYSSLSYLHQFLFDTLKIDRSFISAMDHDPRDYQIVQTIVALARNLDMDMIAEGVETEDQAAQLIELGCQHAQGFLYSPAVESHLAEAFILENLAEQVT